MIPHLLHVFSTFAVGGPQIRLAKIINAAPRHYRHTVVSLDGHSEALSWLDDPNAINLIDASDIKGKPVSKRAKCISALIKQSAPDVLMTYNWGAIEWAALNRLRKLCPHIHWEDGFLPDEKETTKWHRDCFRQLALSGKAQVVVPSLSLQKIAQTRWRIPSSRLTYFPNGIALPTKRIRPATPRKQLTFVTLATLRPEKNIARMIHAFLAADIDAHLLIGGEGKEKSSLEQLIAELNAGQRVKLVGQITDVWQFLSQADAFLLSSDTEQMPISVLEAMAFGLPILATDVGDVRTMVAKPNLPYIVEKSKFLLGLNAMLLDRDNWERVGKANADKARQRFSFDAMLNRFHQLVKQRLT